MDEQELLKKLREAFRHEAAERLNTCAARFLEYEKTEDSGERQRVLEELFREAHSLKGAARAVNLGNIEKLCQSLESLLSTMKKNELQPFPELFDSMHRAVEVVEDIIAAPEDEQRTCHAETISNLIGRMDAARSGEWKGGDLEKPAQSGVAEMTSGDSGDTAEGKEPVAAQPPPPADSPAATGAPLPTDAPEEQKERKASAGLRGNRPNDETIRLSRTRLDSVLLKTEEMIALKMAGSLRLTNLKSVLGSLEAWDKKWAEFVDDFRDLRLKFKAGSVSNGFSEMGESVDALLAFIDWSQAHVEHLGKSAGELTKSTEQDQRKLCGMVDDLLETMKSVTMLPFSTTLDIFPRMVRKIAREQGKEVDLRLEGGSVEIDRRILEEMKDPLIHLLRNAVDHGLEAPDQRKTRGKPSAGSIRVEVSQLDSNTVEILVTDDGRGIELEKVKDNAVARGHLSRKEADELGDKEALSYIFHSGVSTSPIVTELSGRGLGMAIVREKVEKLGGLVALDSKAGEGSNCRIQLPVTMANSQGLLIRAGGDLYVLPITQVSLVLRLHRDEVQRVEGKDTIPLEGRAVSMADLATLLGGPPPDGLADDEHINLVVLESGGKKMAFRVEDVLSEQEILVKGLGNQLVRVRNVAGATILGSGDVVPILNAGDLLKTAAQSTQAMAAIGGGSKVEDKAKSVLVVDDSITSRMLLESILVAAGHKVRTAVDGLEALSLLKSESFDIVVSDVEMPRMNGFDLTEKIRADIQLAELPVIIVTSLDSREEKERGIDAGANGYIVKTSFDQDHLLKVISRFI